MSRAPKSVVSATQRTPGSVVDGSGELEEQLARLLAYGFAQGRVEPVDAAERHRKLAIAALHAHAFRLVHDREPQIRAEAVAKALSPRHQRLGFRQTVGAMVLGIATAGVGVAVVTMQIARQGVYALPGDHLAAQQAPATVPHAATEPATLAYPAQAPVPTRQPAAPQVVDERGTHEPAPSTEDILEVTPARPAAGAPEEATSPPAEIGPLPAVPEPVPVMVAPPVSGPDPAAEPQQEHAAAQSLPSAAPPPEPPPAVIEPSRARRSVVTYGGGRTNIREAPSMGAPIARAVPPSTVLMVFDETPDGWLQVGEDEPIGWLRRTALPR